MARDENKKRSKLLYMIGSLAFAIFIWGVVSYSSGPDITKTVHNLRMVYTGTAELEENGFVIVDNNAPRDIYARVTGKRDDLMNAMDNIEIDVDVSNITEAGEYTLAGTSRTSNSRLTVGKGNYNAIHVTVEESVEKEFPIDIRVKGAGQGKLVKAVPDRQTVRISGGKSWVEKISAVFAEVHTDELGKDGKGVFELRTEAGAGAPPISDERLMLDAYEVSVVCTVYDAVKLPVELEGDAAEHKFAVTPASVEVGVLPGYDIKAVTAVYRSASGSEAEYELKETEGLYIPDDVKTIKVSLPE